MIEITKENVLSRNESLNLQFFNFGSKMRVSMTETISNPVFYTLSKYNIDDLPLKISSLRIGNISEIFNYQQAIFDTLVMLRVKEPTGINAMFKEE